MPYQPSVQDISGQLLAQGMQQRAQGISSGIQGLFQGLQQNQMMTNSSLAKFQAAVAANPQLLNALSGAEDPNNPNAVRLNPDVIKAYTEVKSGKTNVQNTALLAQFADTYNQAQTNQQQRQLQQAQAANLQAEAAKNRLDAARAVLNLSEVGFTPQQLQGAINFGMPAGSIAAPGAAMPSAPAAMPRPAPVSGAVQPTSAGVIPAVPNIPPELMAGVTTQAAGVKPPSTALQTMLGISPQPQASGVGGGLRQVTGEFFPAEVEAAAKTKARLDALSGKSSNWITNARDLMQERRRARAEENEMTPDEFMQYSRNFMKSQEGKPLGERYIVEAMPSTRPGMVSPKISLATATETEKSAIETSRAIATKIGEGRVGDIIARNTAAREDARMLSEIRPAAAVLRQLYEGGELRGDALAPFKANVAAFAKGLGIPLPAEVEKAEVSSQLGQAMMNKMILPLMDRFKGSTSDRDVQLMKAFYPAMATHPEAAMAMLGLLENRIAYVREMDDLAQAWNAHEFGDDLAKYYAASQDIRNRYEGIIPSIEQFSKTYNVTPVKRATQSTYRGSSKSQGIRPEDAKKGVIYIEGSDGLYYPKP